MHSTPRKSQGLTVQRSFVVELYDDADVRSGRIAGRIEHVVTGRSVRFSSADALFAFMADALEDGPAGIGSETRERRRRRC